ncbi:MAG: LysE family transporter [Chloroflexota bacterium]
MFETIILPSISLGLSATSIPGPLQAYLLNITLNYGWRRGLLVILSPLITDGPIIFVTVFVLQQIPEWAIQSIRVAGGLLLLWIAWGAWQQLQSGAEFTADSENIDIDDSGSSDDAPLRILGTAAAMNLLSPGPYLFWSTVTGPLLVEAMAISPLAAIGMLLGFYGTFLGGMSVLVFVFNQLGSVDQRTTQAILVITIGLLVWFATQLILVDALGWRLVHQILTAGIVLTVGAYLGRGWIASRTPNKAD